MAVPRSEDAITGVLARPMLTPRQQSLCEALAGKSQHLYELYMGGLMVLADAGNPSSIRLAGAAMRELLDDLAKAAGVAQHRGDSLPSRINSLRARLDGKRRTLEVPQPATADVGAFLEELDTFFERYDKTNLSREAKAREVLVGLNIGTGSVPQAVLVLQVKAWAEFVGGFNAVLHGRTLSRSSFDELLERFEAFLMDLLTPTTFDDFAAIDELTSQGPPSA